MFDTIAGDHDFDYSLVCLCRSLITYALDRYAHHPSYEAYFLSDDFARTK